MITINSFAQHNTTSTSNHSQGKSNTAAFGVNIPLGEFSKTHFAGISIDYSWSHHRFGKLKALPKSIIGFVADAGIDYYLGKKETVVGYDYRYAGYFYLRAFGGAIYNLHKEVNITLTTGAIMGIYKGNVDFGFGFRFSGSYSITDNISLIPGIIFLNHKEAAALWAGKIQVAYSF